MTFPLLFSGGPGSPSNGNNSNPKDSSIFAATQALFNQAQQAGNNPSEIKTLDTQVLAQLNQSLAGIPDTLTLNTDAVEHATALNALFQKAQQVSKTLGTNANQRQAQAIDTEILSALDTELKTKEPARTPKKPKK